VERYKDGNLEDLGSILDGLGKGDTHMIHKPDEDSCDGRVKLYNPNKEAIDEYVEGNGLVEGPSWSDIGNPIDDIENCAKKLRESAGRKEEEPYVDVSNYKEVIEEMNRSRDGK
jgi:hypothetical protein